MEHPDRWHFSRRTFLRGGVAAALAGAASGSSVLAACGSPATASYPRTRVPIGPMNPTGAAGLGPGGALLPPGTRPFPDVPAGADMLPEIEHVVVLMMENHSFDDHLGMLGRGDGLTRGPSGAPINYNPDPHGGFVRSWHLPTTCQPVDEGTSQDWNASHVSWNGGKNNGFVKACGAWAMGFWTQEDLPFYYSMASAFPIGDRYFSSVMAQTYPNRRFLIGATALGNVSTDLSGVSMSDFPNGVIFDRLDHYEISWKNYAPDLPTLALVFPLFEATQMKGKQHLGSIDDFLADCAGGTLPGFSLVDPYINYSEENGDISVGEGYAAAIIQAVMRSPLWPTTALFWTYDEHGGYFDHVPPAPAVLPDTVPPDLKGEGPAPIPGAYDYTGFRVPFSVVSPWAKRDHVSHVSYDHTSILKFVETKWNLPSLTYRDANAHNLLDFFSFAAPGQGSRSTGGTPPFLEPPSLAAPLNPFAGVPKPICSDGKVTDFGGEVAAARWEEIPSGTNALLAAHARRHSYPD